MNRELLYVIEQVGREKGIGSEVLFEALESALLSASKRTLGTGDNVRLTLDRKTGAIRVFAEKKVVETVTDPKLEIGLEAARHLRPEAQLEETVEVDLPPQEFGRIAAQTAKQVILQRVREAERQGIFSEFKDREGSLVRGTVHRIEALSSGGSASGMALQGRLKRVRGAAVLDSSPCGWWTPTPTPRAPGTCLCATPLTRGPRSWARWPPSSTGPSGRPGPRVEPSR